MLEEISFSSYFGKFFKVKWLQKRFLSDILRHYDLLKAADINAEKHLLEYTPYIKDFKWRYRRSI